MNSTSNKPLAMVVFDMAGTVVDEGNLVYKTLTKAIQEAGHDVSLETVLSIAAGMEKRAAIAAVLEKENLSTPATDEEVDKIHTDFKKQLEEAYKTETIKQQPGADDAFQKLHSNGIKVVLNTGYDRFTAETLLRKLDWKLDRDIDDLVTASDADKNRPDPAMINVAMQNAGITDSGSVAKVGDSVVDIEEGQNAKCGTVIGITTGAHNRETLNKANPDFVVDSLAECLDVLGV